MNRKPLNFWSAQLAIGNHSESHLMCCNTVLESAQPAVLYFKKGLVTRLQSTGTSARIPNLPSFIELTYNVTAMRSIIYRYPRKYRRNQASTTAISMVRADGFPKQQDIPVMAETFKHTSSPLVTTQEAICKSLVALTLMNAKPHSYHRPLDLCMWQLL